MEVSGKFCASRHDVARTGSISAYVASPQFNFDSKRDVAAAGARGILFHNVGHRLGGIW